jgi:guanine deaminase
MREAIRLAVKSVADGGGPFGCVVVKDGRVIGEGVNRVTLTNDPTAHAEVVAIRQACAHLGGFQLEGCTLYCSCEPCPMCLGAIYWSRPSAVFFAASREEAAAVGFDDEFIYTEVGLEVERRRIPMRRLMADPGQEPFEVWRETPGRHGY